MCAGYRRHFLGQFSRGVLWALLLVECCVARMSWVLVGWLLTVCHVGVGCRRGWTIMHSGRVDGALMVLCLCLCRSIRLRVCCVACSTLLLGGAVLLQDTTAGYGVGCIPRVRTW